MLGEDLDTLGGGVGALVKLTREKFHGKGGLICCELKGIASGFDLGLGEYELAGLGEVCIVQAVYVIALDDADLLKAVKAEVLLEVVEEFFGRGVELRLFFDKNAMHSSVKLVVLRLEDCPAEVGEPSALGKWHLR